MVLRCAVMGGERGGEGLGCAFGRVLLLSHTATGPATCPPPPPALAPCLSAPQSMLSGRERNGNPRQCLRVELTRKQTMMYYQPHKSRLFLKIVLSTPNLVAPCRSERGASGGASGVRALAGLAATHPLWLRCFAMRALRRHV